MKSFFVIAVVLLSVLPVDASEPIPFDSPRWEITAEESRIEEFEGKRSLLLRGGLALIKDADFTDGVIEYSCAFARGRAFIGSTWRVQDESNREEFYIRSHQSGNPDANQYTPVFNGLTAWQLYHGEGYGVPVEYEFDTWIPVKIVVSGGQAEVYIGDIETPVLFIDELKRPTASGSVGLSVANFGPGRYADFRFEKIDKPTLKSRIDRRRTPPPGAVMKWQLSNSFNEADIKDEPALTPSITKDLTWDELATESTGLANISRLRTLERTKNTVFARLIIDSEKAQPKTLAFGYSDRARVFFDGRLIYTGSNGFRSRDYRYLGTIGFFDALTLPLKKGRNEVWFAVSESFGGWGLQAAFDDMDGITVTH